MSHSNHISLRVCKEHSCLLVQHLGRVWVGGALLPTMPFPSLLTMPFCSFKFESGPGEQLSFCAFFSLLLLRLDLIAQLTLISRGTGCSLSLTQKPAYNRLWIKVLSLLE